MATSDRVTATEDKSDVFSDETGDEVVEPERTFGFDMKTAKTDLTLLVEDKKIYVTRVILETISPTFEKIVSEQFHDGAQNEVKIHNKNFEDFVEFLACIYPGKMNEVTSTNVHKVLPLAFEYDVDFLKKRCESVLIDEMARADVDESCIVRCTNAASPYLFSVRQLGLDEIVKSRLQEIQISDEQLPLDTEGKIYVYEKMLTSLRSEACKYRYLSAGRNCKNSENLDLFTDAKYKRLDFQLDVEMDKTLGFEAVIWNRRHNIVVQRDGHINFTLTVDENNLNPSRFPIAFKVVVKNNDPLCPEGDFGRQKCTFLPESKPKKRYYSSHSISVSLPSLHSLCVSLPKEDIKDIKYRMNGLYTISVHILMNKPEYF